VEKQFFVKFLACEATLVRTKSLCLNTQFEENGLLKFLHLELVFKMSSRDKENMRKERDIPTKAKKSPGNPNRLLILKI